MRIEHVQHSRCREDFLKRRAENDAAKVEAKKAGKTVVATKLPAAPRRLHPGERSPPSSPPSRTISCVRVSSTKRGGWFVLFDWC